MWLIFSDIHFHLYKSFSTILPNGLNSRFMQQIEVIKDVKRIARRKNVTDMFFLGDLFDSQAATIDKVLLNAVFFIIKSLAEVANLYLLVGNHDNAKGISILTPFESIPNVTVINEVKQIVVDGKSIDFVPWLEKPPEEKSEYCFGHFGINGATVGNGLLIEADEMDAKLLNGYKLILSGHYHTRQMVGENMYQIGGVMNTSFKDSEEDKGIWLLDPATDKLDFVPVKSPKFRTRIVITEDELETFIKEDKSKDYWKLVVKSDGLTVPEMPPNVIVEYDYMEKSLSELPIDTTSISNLVPIVKEFITNSNTSLPKDILIKKAVELLEV